jgi:hypothetical protein
VIVAGALLLLRAMRLWTRRTVPADVPKPSKEGPKDEYVARLEEELKKRD